MKWLARILTFTTTLVATPSLAQEVVRQVQGNVRLEVRFQPGLTLADTITATIRVEAKPGSEVMPPPGLPDRSPWLLVSRSAEEREMLPSGLVRWQQTYRCAPKASGDAPFIFPDVRIREPSGEEQTIFWNAIPIHVAQPSAAPDPAKLRGGVDIERTPSPAVQERSRGWWLVVPLALIVGVTILAWRASRRRRVSSPLDRARRELNRLIALKLPEQGKSERFITLLTMLLREYLQRAHDWPARRQTTREFLAQAEACSALPMQDRQFLAAIIERSDAAKYAGVATSGAECQRWASATAQFFDRCQRRLDAKAAETSKANPVEKNGQTG